jgi:Glycosyl transferases group 1
MSRIDRMLEADLRFQWIFLNSSVSEGLPLALGEAALTGVPVVCTDVGASFRVVTDPITSKRFSAVVPPNDALSLARAQINVLALLDEWSEFAEDEEGYHPKLSAQPTGEEVEGITKRMYEKTKQRRRLGMMGRTNVLNSFSSQRYLREHEQMLWIGKYRSGSYRSRVSTPISSDNGESTPVGDASAHSSRLWYKAAVQEKAKVERITSIPISSNASWAITEGEQSSRSNSSHWPEISIPEKARTSTTDKSSLFIEF